MVAFSRERVATAVEPAVTGAGFDLEDVVVTSAGRRTLVRVVVDRDGGIDLDAVAEVSRVVSAALDADDATGDAPYTLEVTSPGVDRPLTLPRHWRRATGRLVTVSGFTGRIAAAEEHAVTLLVDGASRVLRYDELGPGRVQVEFDRPAAGVDAAEGDTT